MPIERTLAWTLSHSALTVARSAPSSAAAPTIFSARTVPPDAAATRGVEGVLDRDVVGDDHGLDVDPFGLGQLGRELEVHDVAGVVLDDVQHAGTAVDRLGGGQHLVRDGRREDGTRAGRVEHPSPDEPAMHRLVAGATAGDHADLALTGCVLADDDVRRLDPDKVGMRQRHAGERLVDQVVGLVDQLLHRCSPLGAGGVPRRRDGMIFTM